MERCSQTFLGLVIFFFVTCHPSTESPCIPAFLTALPFDPSLPLICCWVKIHQNLRKMIPTVIYFAHSLKFGQGSVGSALFCSSSCQLGQLKGCSNLETRGWGHLKTHWLTYSPVMWLVLACLCGCLTSLHDDD